MWWYIKKAQHFFTFSDFKDKNIAAIILKINENGMNHFWQLYCPEKNCELENIIVYIIRQDKYIKNILASLKNSSENKRYIWFLIQLINKQQPKTL